MEFYFCALWHLNFVRWVMHVCARFVYTWRSAVRRHILVLVVPTEWMGAQKKKERNRINCKSVPHKCYPNAAVLQFAVINSFALSFTDILCCVRSTTLVETSSRPGRPLSRLTAPHAVQICRSNIFQWFFRPRRRNGRRRRRRHTLAHTHTQLFVSSSLEHFRWSSRYDDGDEFHLCAHFNRKLLPCISRVCLTQRFPPFYNTVKCLFRFFTCSRRTIVHNVIG